jgi:DNA-binding MarR family transcriptional regulator
VLRHGSPTESNGRRESLGKNLHRQAEYLAYIHLYTRLHRRPPAETDMQEYFRVSPPSVHQMVLTLERAGFIRRQPRTPRSIELLVDPTRLPDLL